MIPEGAGTTLDPSAGSTLAGTRGEGVPPLPALTVLSHADLARIGDRVFLGELAQGRPACSPARSHGSPLPAPPGEPLADPF